MFISKSLRSSLLFCPRVFQNTLHRWRHLYLWKRTPCFEKFLIEFHFIPEAQFEFWFHVFKVLNHSSCVMIIFCKARNNGHQWLLHNNWPRNSWNSHIRIRILWAPECGNIFWQSWHFATKLSVEKASNFGKKPMDFVIVSLTLL